MTTENPFKPGDVVELRSGGPKMTTVQDEKDNMKCIWFDGSDPKSASFYWETLKHADD